MEVLGVTPRGIYDVATVEHGAVVPFRIETACVARIVSFPAVGIAEFAVRVVSQGFTVTIG